MPKPKVPPCNSNHVEYIRGKSKFCKLKRFTTSNISKKLNTIEALLRGIRIGGGGGPPPPPPPPPSGLTKKQAAVKPSSANSKRAQMMNNLMKAVAARRKKMN
jgi:hypothetical protein